MPSARHRTTAFRSPAAGLTGLQAVECPSCKPVTRLAPRRRRQAQAACGGGLRPGLTAPPRRIPNILRSAESPH